MCLCNDMTRFDFKSPEMRAYLGTYGPHFNKQLCFDAVNLMRGKGEEGKDKKITPISKDELKEKMEAHGIEVKHNALYDAVYVHSMAMADYWGSSIDDERHLMLFIKDYLDDPDGYEGIAFSRWYADMCKKGIVLDWEDYLR